MPVSLAEHTMLISGPAGALEMLLTVPDEPKHTTAIICHPHPLYGGTMTNKVVTTLARTFQDLHLNTIRFNFRGIGKSEGQYAEGEGELDDLLAVIKWVQENQPNHTLWLAGFSFGAYIAARAATQIDVEQVVLVAPAIENFSMMSLPSINAPCIVAQGEQDEVVSPEAVYTWVATRNPEPTLLRFPNATHFFHGQLTELRDRLTQTLKPHP